MSRDVFYSIQQVAAALEVSKKLSAAESNTVNLKRLKTAAESGFPRRSLRKWILRAIAIARPKRTYAKCELRGINLEQNIGQSVFDTGYNSVDTPPLDAVKGKVSIPTRSRRDARHVPIFCAEDGSRKSEFAG